VLIILINYDRNWQLVMITDMLQNRWKPTTRTSC